MPKNFAPTDPKALEVYNQMKAFEARGDFSGMADYVIDIYKNQHSSGDDFEKQEDGFTSFISELVQLDEKGNVIEEKKEVLFNFQREIIKKRVDAMIEFDGMLPAWEEKVRSGEVKEAELYKNDNKMVEKFASDIVLLQTETGKKMNATTDIQSAINVVFHNNMKWSTNPQSADKEKLFTYTTDSLFAKKYAKEQKKVTEEKALECINKYDRLASKFKRGEFELDPSHTITENGLPKFSNIPANVKEVTEADTPEKLAEIRTRHTDKIEASEKYIKDAHKVGEKALAMLDVMFKKKENGGRVTVLPEIIRKNEIFKDKYIAFRNALDVAATIGNGFEIENSVPPHAIIKIDTIIIDYTKPAVEELAKATKEYLTAIKENVDKSDLKKLAFLTDPMESLDKDLAKLSGRMSENEKKIGKAGSIEALVSHEKKEVKLVDQAITVKGMTDQVTAITNVPILSNNITGLTKHIAGVGQAQTWSGSGVYDKAETSLKELETISKNYLQAKQAGVMSKEDLYKLAEKMQKKAKETEEKIEKYYARKQGQKKLDDKSKRRLAAMQKSMKSVKAISASADNAIKDLDNASTAGLKGSEKHVTAIALESIRKLQDLTSKSGKFTAEDKLSARNAIAAIMIQETKMFNNKGNSSREQVQQKINQMAEDPAFQKVTDNMITKTGIRSFLSNRQAKSERIMDGFYAEKSKGFVAPAPKTKTK